MMTDPHARMALGIRIWAIALFALGTLAAFWPAFWL
jgi:hypothetical protein